MYTWADLTDKQRMVFKFIYEKIKRENLPPTIREIAQKFHFSSTGTVRDYLRVLAAKGYIRLLENKSRGIELIKETLFQIPIVGSVMAGNPNLAVEDIEGYFNLDSLLFPDGKEVFFLRVKGNSMIEAGILPGDLVLVRRQKVAQVGEIVVVLIGEEATVKILRKKGNAFYLDPANANYKPIPLNEDASIIGKVINVVRQLR